MFWVFTRLVQTTVAKRGATLTKTMFTPTTTLCGSIQIAQGHLINGNDGGINITYDDGKTWFKCNNPPVGQFYHINVDMAEPYNVYGGLQDNGVWFGSSKVRTQCQLARFGTQ